MLRPIPIRKTCMHLDLPPAIQYMYQGKRYLSLLSSAHAHHTYCIVPSPSPPGCRCSVPSLRPARAIPANATFRFSGRQCERRRRHNEAPPTRETRCYISSDDSDRTKRPPPSPAPPSLVEGCFPLVHDSPRHYCPTPWCEHAALRRGDSH